MDWEGDAEEDAARREAAARQKDSGKKKRRRGRDDGEPRTVSQQQLGGYAPGPRPRGALCSGLCAAPVALRNTMGSNLRHAVPCRGGGQ